MAEKDYYEPIKRKLEELFASKGRKVYLEITANKRFSNRLKGAIPDYRQIIFSFLAYIAPDITGLIEDGSNGFVVIEVKDQEIESDHIYQVRKYAEFFDARLAFLISTKEIPDEIKRLAKAISSLLSLPGYGKLILVQLDEETKSFKDWYPENPFA